MDSAVKVHCFDERPKVNIVFTDLNCTVYSGNKEKCLLNNISGEFRAGEITAILGPSGAGKTTLLNVLAGYKSTKVSGLISINNQRRNLQQFYKISRYIMQENSLQPYLTVRDSIMMAADFKLGYRVTKEEKIKLVSDILKDLRLTKVLDNRTEKLSGGERKRLAIALELINNPPVIFLDEPTSGLDDQASFQCVSVLKQLAKEGKTVICSIHSPSAKIFALFDLVYIVSEGQCVFQGQGDQILPFLEAVHLRCPVHYNPIDFFLDVASGEYGQQLHQLVSLTQNGKVSYHRVKEIDNTDFPLISTEKNEINFENIPDNYISTILQMKILLHRMFLQFYRNKTELYIRTMMYAIMITVFSLLFYDCGNDATKIMSNFSFLLLSIIALMYCALMPPLIHFPVEVKIIRSEYFNRWYNIPAYFFSKSLAVIPGYMIFTILYVCITYPLTDQPLFVDRMIKFILVCFFVNLIVDACSMSVASVFNEVNSFFVGVAIMVFPVLLTVYGFGFPFDMQPLIVKIMLRTSFLRYALDAVVEVVYFDRTQHLNCPDTEEVCPITSPEVIVKMFGYGTAQYWVCLTVLFTFYVVIKCVNIFLLRQRLNPGKPAEVAKRLFEYGKNLLIKTLP